MIWTPKLFSRLIFQLSSYQQMFNLTNFILNIVTIYDETLKIVHVGVLKGIKP